MSDKPCVTKVSFVTYAQNNGDGSVSILFFNTIEEAEDYAIDNDERHNEDIDQHHLEFDEDGLLLNGTKPEWKDEE